MKQENNDLECTTIDCEQACERAEGSTDEVLQVGHSRRVALMNSRAYGTGKDAAKIRNEYAVVLEQKPV
jgi:hypothetical protein